MTCDKNANMPVLHNQDRPTCQPFSRCLPKYTTLSCIYTTDITYEHMYMCSFLVWKNAWLNYREFDLQGDLVGVPHTWFLSALSFITLLKLVWREWDMVAMNEWKKKCVGLQKTWVSKRTVVAAFELGRHEWFALRRLITNSGSSAFTGGFII